MKIILNGEERALEAPVTVADLLSTLGLTGQRVAVEINREIVPKSAHPSRRLADEDRVEVVRAIGGG
jgi:sulfur carrier protein